MNVSIVIPARNEQESIGATIHSVLDRVTVPYELLVVCDHCTDQTEAIVQSLAAKHPQIKILHNTERKGSFSNSVITGFNAATGDRIVPIMADNCDDPATINIMARKIEDGFDVVCASRYVRGGRKTSGPWLQDKLSRLVCMSLKLLTNIPTWDAANSYKMYRMTTLKKLKYDIPDAGTEYSMALLYRAYNTDASITEVPTVWTGRSIPLGEEHKILWRLPKYWYWYRSALAKKKALRE